MWIIGRNSARVSSLESAPLKLKCPQPGRDSGFAQRLAGAGAEAADLPPVGEMPGRAEGALSASRLPANGSTLKDGGSRSTVDSIPAV